MGPVKPTLGGTSKVVSAQRMGSAEGLSPFAGGMGVTHVFGFGTPFLARKGAGGMVETAVEGRRSRNADRRL